MGLGFVGIARVPRIGAAQNMAQIPLNAVISVDVWALWMEALNPKVQKPKPCRDCIYVAQRQLLSLSSGFAEISPAVSRE